MKIVRAALRLLQDILLGYLAAWIFGLLLSLLFLLFILLRRVRIEGYWRLVGAVLRGRVMILMNHPTVFFETFGIGALVFPWCLVWSTPDKHLLDKWGIPGWVRIVFRCIQLDRTKRRSGAEGATSMERVLFWRGVVVAHPERGRTFGEANRHKVPLVRGNRRMQKIESSLTRVAHEAKASILVGWVQVPDDAPVDLKVSFRRMFGKENSAHWPVVYSFKQPLYRTSEPFDRAAENQKLQEAILSA